jgi:hypothetical protein
MSRSGWFSPELPQVEAVFDNAAFDMAVDGGPEHQAVAEINEAAPPTVGMAACNACIRNPPKQYVPSEYPLILMTLRARD